MNGAAGLKKDFFSSKRFLAILLAVTAALRVAFSVFPRIVSVYPDELLNLQLAQGIHAGRLAVSGSTAGFPGLLYPALLAPLYGIADPEIRLTVIAVLNALLVSSALIPVWLLCRRILADNRLRLAAAALFLCSPDLWLSSTVTAECLYIPIALWGIWLLYCAFENGTPDLRISCALGAWAYLSWMTAQSGTALIIGTLALYCREAVSGKDGKKAVAGGLCFAAVFCAAYLAVMMALFEGKPYGYSMKMPESPQAFLFLAVAAASMMLHFATGVLLFPVIVPFAFRKRLKAPQRNLLVLIGVYSAMAAVMTAFGLSGSFGRMDMRVMLLRFIPVSWVFLLIWLSLQETQTDGKLSFRHPAVLLTSSVILLGLLVLRVPRFDSVTDAPMLLAAEKLNGGTLRIILAKAGPALCFFAGLALLKAGKRKVLAAAVIVPLLAVSVLNGVLLNRRIREEGKPPAEEIRVQAKELDRFLGGLDGNILMIRSETPGLNERLADSYLRTGGCSVTLTELYETALAAEKPAEIPVSETGIRAGNVDYIVCAGETFTFSPSAENEITPDGISFIHVYRNETGDRLDLTDLFALKPGELIRFRKSDPDYLRYPVSGFSHTETAFTWTEGMEASVTLKPVSVQPGPLVLVWSRNMTIGEQRCRIYAGEELLYDGTVSGKGVLEIPVPEQMRESGELITFRFAFPDARQPGNGDQRILAAAFESISLEER